MTGLVGGVTIFAADLERFALAEIEERRDKIAIARHPVRDRMRERRYSPEKQQMGIHWAISRARQLAVAAAGANGAELGKLGVERA